DVVRRLAAFVHRETGEAHICLVGKAFEAPAVAAAVADAAPFADVWVHPLTGHASAALGAAALAWQQAGGSERIGASLQGACGPAFSSHEIAAFLDTHEFPAHPLASSAELLNELMDRGGLVGVFRKRLCLTGPTAGSRGILLASGVADLRRLDAHVDSPATEASLPVDAADLSALRGGGKGGGL